MQEACDVVEIIRLAKRPEKTGSDFIADGDDFNGHAVGGEGVAYF